MFTSKVPDVFAEGIHVICEEFKLTILQVIPPIVTWAPDAKPLPEIVSRFPPDMLPEVGAMLPIVGGLTFSDLHP